MPHNYVSSPLILINGDLGENRIALSDWDKGYWCAIQNSLTAYSRPDRQMAEFLIKNAGFNKARCLALIENNSFYGEELAEIVKQIYPTE